MCGWLRRRPFASLLGRIDAQTRGLEAQNAAILAQLTRMEKTMADNESALLGKLSDLEKKVDAYTTERGNELAAAVAAAKAAWDKEDEAEHAAALAKIDEIGGKLKTFSPSGN